MSHPREIYILLQYVKNIKVKLNFIKASRFVIKFFCNFQRKLVLLNLLINKYNNCDKHNLKAKDYLLMMGG